MFKTLTISIFLTVAAFAGTWFIDGSDGGDSLRLDQTVPQTVRNGSVNVEGRYARTSVPDPAELYSTPTYSEYYDLYGASDNGSYVDTSAGNFQDQSFTARVYPYGYCPYGLLVSPSYAEIILSDNSSTPFRLQLSWQDYGAQGMTVEGYYIQIDDGVNTYWTDAGSVTSLQVQNFTGWNSGPLNVSSWAPYSVPTGNLYGENHWYLYAKREASGKTVYSVNASSRYDADYNYYWANTLYWDAVEGATSYILYNETTGYWIETQDLMVEDSGDYSLWNYGTPEVSPASPLVEIGDMFVGLNSNAVARINGDGQFETDVGTGTSPLKVNSPTLNDNLNADLLDGYHADAFQPAGSYQPAGNYELTGVSTTNIVSRSPLIATSKIGQLNYLALSGTNSVYSPSGYIKLSVDDDGYLRVTGAVIQAFSLWNTNLTGIAGSGIASAGVRGMANGIVYAQGDAPGSLYSSIDAGATWQVVSSVSTFVKRVAYGASKTVLWSSTGKIHYSADGLNFTMISVGDNGSPYGGLAFGNGKFLLAVANNIYSSTDGVNWTALNPPGVGGLSAVEYIGNNVWLAGGNCAYFVSVDNGMTWSSSRYINGGQVYDIVERGGFAFFSTIQNLQRYDPYFGTLSMCISYPQGVNFATLSNCGGAMVLSRFNIDGGTNGNKDYISYDGVQWIDLGNVFPEYWGYSVLISGKICNAYRSFRRYNCFNYVGYRLGL